MAFFVSSYLQRRNGIYYFRRSIPKPLQALAGQTELVLSLRTHLRDTATYRSIACLQISNRLLSELAMSGRLDPNFKAKVQATLKSFIAESAQHHEDRFLSGESVPQLALLNQHADAIDKYLEIAPIEAIEADLSALLSPMLEMAPQLNQIGSSDPITARRYVARELLKSFRALNKYASAIQRGEDVVLPDPSTRPASQPAASRHSPLISAAWAEYVAEKRSSWRDSTFAQYQSHIAELISDDFIGDRPIHKLDREDLITYRNALQQLPAARNKSKKYRHHSVKELLSMEIPLDDRLSDSSINERLILIGSFTKWCKEVKGYLEHDPTYQVQITGAESKERAPYTDQEIQTLFDPAHYRSPLVTKPYQFWLPLIALHTGARISEIAQLLPSDVTTAEGIAVFRIMDEEADKRLKTKAARRLVPVHPSLIEIGLLDYAEHARTEGYERLFPDLPTGARTAGGKASEWFTQFRRERGIPDVDTLGREKVFHSFRNTVITRLSQARLTSDGWVAPQIIQQIVGHEKSLLGATSTYTAAYPIKDCLEAINMLGLLVKTESLKESWRLIVRHKS